MLLKSVEFDDDVALLLGPAPSSETYSSSGASSDVTASRLYRSDSNYSAGSHDTASQLDLRPLDAPEINEVRAYWSRYDTRCYFNVRSKADMSQLNLPHGNVRALQQLFLRVTRDRISIFR